MIFHYFNMGLYAKAGTYLSG